MTLRTFPVTLLALLILQAPVVASWTHGPDETAPVSPGPLARPILAPSLPRSVGPPTEADVARPADAAVERHGVLLELWVPREPTPTGSWLPVAFRVTNTGKSRILHEGDTRNLACKSPIRASLHIAELFDPGESWTGNAAILKEGFLESHAIGRLLLGPWSPESDGGACADVGVVQPLRAGESFTIEAGTSPTYVLRNQPLPSGTATVTARYTFERPQTGDRQRMLEVSAPVAIAGDTVSYASPQRLVDALLMRPELSEFVADRDFTSDWNTTFWPVDQSGHDLTAHESFFEGGPAPIDEVRISISADGAPPDSWARAWLDPWDGTLHRFDIR